MIEETLPDFKGKTVVFYASTNLAQADWANEGIALVSPSFQIIGNRFFVVGKTPYLSEPSTDDNWSSNRECGVAWDCVFSYIAVPSEEYQYINYNSEK
ncbi:MAG: hypothetical protein K1X72_12470 [Pyrinomonadaceae bacterium]|nr:hypothetical protein [Pyrinomonadaceae bacterium]